MILFRKNIISPEQTWNSDQARYPEPSIPKINDDVDYGHEENLEGNSKDK